MAATIQLRCPSKYASSSATSPEGPPQPTLDFLLRTWTVTHSTLPMWRSARNVHITYKSLPDAPDGLTRVDDLVEYQSNKDTATPVTDIKVKTVAGVDTQAAAGDLTSWNWKGKGLLFFVKSHWEIIGFGERTTKEGKSERWVVTWFQKTIFSAEGFDVYCDAAEGVSEETFKEVMTALEGLDEKVKELVGQMKAVEIKLA